MGDELKAGKGEVDFRISGCCASYCLRQPLEFLLVEAGISRGFVRLSHPGPSGPPAEENLSRLPSRIEEEDGFRFDESFAPERGAAGWQVSNGPILGMAPLAASLEQFDAAGLDALCARSARLTGYLESLIDVRLAGMVEIITPRRVAARGAQLSVRATGGRETGRALFEGLAAAGVVCDWREPDIVRLAPAPLYNSFEDCWRCVDAALNPSA